MYLELAMLAPFVFYSCLDVKTRKIGLHWFVIPFLAILIFKILTSDITITDVMFSAMQAVFVLAAYFTRLFGPADMAGMLLLSFAVPFVGPFPAAVSVLALTIIIQSFGIISSNIMYNLQDMYQDRTLFYDVPHLQKARRIRTVYWSLMARRRRENDRYVLSAQRNQKNGELRLALSRKNTELCHDDDKYVYSAHPQFVYITVSYALILFVAMQFGVLI